MKLKYNYGNTTNTINLVTDPPSMHRLPIEKDGITYYAKLGEINHPEASNLRVRRNGKTFAAIKNYNPVTFDECGNIWTKKGTPSASNGQLHLAALTDGVMLSNLNLAPQDFSAELFVNRKIVQDVGWGEPISIYCTPMLDSDIRNVVFQWRPAANSGLKLRIYTLNTSSTWQVYTKTPIYENQLYHLAISYVHATETWYFFVDGQLQASSVFDGMTNISSIYFGTNLIADMDEFRFSYGIARWTQNFSPPSAPYEVDEYTKFLMHF